MGDNAAMTRFLVFVGALLASGADLVAAAQQAAAPNAEREFLSRVRRLTVEGRRAGDTHEDHLPGVPARGVDDAQFDLTGDGVDPSSESFLQRLDVDLFEGCTEVQGSDVGVGSEPPERRQRDVGHAPAEVGLELDLERTGVDGRLRERLQCDRGARDADQDGSDDLGPTGHS